jgi:stearoyl-CoA desaturase (delta-9 desaturase)
MAKTNLIQILKNTLHHQNLWGSIIPMQFIGAYAIYSIWTGSAPNWWWIATIIGYIGMAMLGVSAGYHRLFCHQGYQVSPAVKRILLWLAMIAGQGGPVYWIGIHRGYHHRYSDTERDAHSPRQGFWHSYILWMFKMQTMSIRSVIYLLKDPDMVFAHKHYQKIFWLSHLSVALINFEVWLYLMGFAAFLTLHCFLLQTSVTHLPWAGYRNYKLKNDSVNVPWLFPLILGECWHNNHHRDSTNIKYGHRWWELDPTSWLIKLIRQDKK